MSEERRRGLTVDEQKDMYMKVHKIYTVLFGNGVKGKIEQFEEQDRCLDSKIGVLNKRMFIASGFIAAIAFIAPYLLPKILGG